MSEVFICGNDCEHNHDSPNGPTGCCPEGHGPYMYYCQDCHEVWRLANPERVAEIQEVVAAVLKK